MKFYNREIEIQKLKDAKELSEKKGAQLVVLIGRRRIGKSELMKKTFKKQESIYFFVSKKSSKALLHEFTNIYNQHSEIAVKFFSWENFFHALFKLAINSKKVILIDEFQDFSNIKDENIFSTLQKLWEEYQHKKNLNVVVAGSVISLLENIFYSKKEPLYGRATRKLFLDEFKFPTVYKILKDNLSKEVTIKDILYFYTVFGGSPYYYKQIESHDLFGKDIFYIVKELLLDSQSSLKNEGREVLVKEFGKEHSSYFSILEAIALKKDTFTLIESYTGSDSSYLLKNLKILEDKFRLIKKQTPIFPNNQNITKYIIVNRFLFFWFRYTYSNQSNIEIDQSSLVLKKVKSELDTLSGHTFEHLCAEFLLYISLNESVDLEINKIGKWWDKQGEIDMIIDEGKKGCIFVECKLSSNNVTQKEIDKLISTSQRVNATKHKKKRYLFLVAEELSTDKASLLAQNDIKFYDGKDFFKYLKRAGL